MSEAFTREDLSKALLVDESNSANSFVIQVNLRHRTMATALSSINIKELRHAARQTTIEAPKHFNFHFIIKQLQLVDEFEVEI